MSHTEKPWQMLDLGARLGDYTGSRFVIRSEKNAPGGIAVIMGGLGDDEERANAHLIAAAPEMLATLETIAGFAPGNGDVCEIIARRAREALKKAYGEQ